MFTEKPLRFKMFWHPQRGHLELENFGVPYLEHEGWEIMPQGTIKLFRSYVSGTIKPLLRA